MTSAEKSVIPEFTEKLELEGVLSHFELTGKTYKNINSESELSFMGLKTSSGVQTASLKSIHGLSTWYMEEAEELNDDGTEETECTFDKIDNSIRTKGVDLRTILTWNPSNEDSFIYKRFFKDRGIDITFNGVHEDTLYIYTTYKDNIDNLHKSFIDKAEKTKEVNLPRYNHIYKGIPIKENALALWKLNTMIAPYRVREAPELKRIVVAVDPSVTNTGRQDECGIVAAGEGFDGHYYVIRDMSDLLTTKEWALTVVGLYHELKADKVIAEVNQGGALVTESMNNVDPSIFIKTIVAKRSKILRAEPVSLLYEEGRVHHVGTFQEMEQEMCNYTGDPKEKSPNRLDAVVYALADLSRKGGPELSISFI